MANFYLVTRVEGTEEVTADFYERQEQDWVFVRGGGEVYRVEMGDVVSITKTPKDLASDVAG